MRRVLRLGPLALYGAAASWVWSRDGVPVLDDRMLPWLLGLILALSFTDLRRRARGLLVDWLPFIAALTAYDLLRGIADGRLLPAHARPQMWVDTYVFGWPLAGRIDRAVLALYPLAMAFALVYTGEHYVVEIMLGCAYAVAVRAAVDRIIPWWSNREAAAAIPERAEPSPRIATRGAIS